MQYSNHHFRTKELNAGDNKKMRLNICWIYLYAWKHVIHLFFLYETVSENIFLRLVSSASKIKGMGGGGGGQGQKIVIFSFVRCRSGY